MANTWVVTYITPYGNIQEALFEQESFAALFIDWLFVHGIIRSSITSYIENYDEVVIAFTGGQGYEVV